LQHDIEETREGDITRGVDAAASGRLPASRLCREHAYSTSSAIRRTVLPDDRPSCEDKVLCCVGLANVAQGDRPVASWFWLDGAEATYLAMEIIDGVGAVSPQRNQELTTLFARIARDRPQFRPEVGRADIVLGFWCGATDETNTFAQCRQTSSFALLRSR
jgi:hypothetical protein